VELTIKLSTFTLVLWVSFLPENPISAYIKESEPQKDLQFNQMSPSLGII